MTLRPDRPSEWGTIGDHEQRIRVLEATDQTTGGGDSVCCPIPLDGLIISPCSIMGSTEPYEGSFSINTAGQFFNILEGESPDYFPIDDTCAGQQLYMRGYIVNCTGMPVTGGVSFSGINALGTHTTATSFPILPDSNPVQGSMQPWVPVSNLFSQAGEVPFGMKVIIGFDGGATPGSGVRTGDYWFQFAWFDATSIQNPDFADSPINPGLEEGQLAVWNGLAWTPLPNGTAGQVLTMSGGVPTWV